MNQDASADFDEAMLAYWRAIEDGQTPLPKDWIERYPHLAADLAEVFAGQDQVNRLAAPLRTLVGTGAEPACATPPAGGVGGATLDHVGDHVRATETPEGIRYRVLRPHARGGLGEVFVAEDTVLRREVALKEIRPERADDPASRARFLREAEVNGRLEHPGIVPVYGLGRHANGRPYYAMRLIQGETLKEAIARFHAADQPGWDPGERSLALRHLLTRFVAVCNGLAYAHSRGVVHRDVKPANVMLGRYGETLVVDWGLAKVVGDKDVDSAAGAETLPLAATADQATRAGSVLGTPLYMAPEQAAGRLDQVGPASDIYSLGATLYCLLTGQPPFQGDDPRELLPQVREGRWLPPRQVKRSVPPALDAICCQAMALEPAERYSSALALAADVEHWLADEPVSAWREPWTVRARRWLNRHRTLTAAAFATVVAAAVCLGAGTVLLNAANARERDARNQSEAQRLRAEAETQKADTQKQIAQAVRVFLQRKLLGQADPTEQADALLRVGAAPGQARENPTIRELLDRAARELTPDRIEAQFPNQPLVQAEILQTIGGSYRGVGAYGPAIDHLKRALDLRQQRLGADHPDTLLTQNNLALTYFDAGKLKEAIRLYEQVRDQRIRMCGPDHPATLTTMNNLAVAYRVAGNLPEAIALFEQARDRQIKTRGPDHSDTLRTLNNLALAYLDAGKRVEAMRLLEQVRDKQVAHFGAQHPHTLTTVNNLAWTYLEEGKLTEAIRLLEQVRDKQIEILAPDHPDTLTTLNNLGWAYCKAGRVAESIRLLEHVRDKQIAKRGLEHLDTLATVCNLGLAYQAAGKTAEPIRLFQQAADLRAKILGPDHPDTLAALHHLAVSYRAVGNLSAAIGLFQQVRDKRMAILGADHLDTQATVNGLGVVYQAAGRLSEAIPLFEQVHVMQVEKLGPDHPATLFTQNNLALAYRADGRLAKAIHLLEQARDRSIAKLGPEHPDTLTTLNNLGAAYWSAKKLHLSVPLFEQVLQTRKQILGLDHPETLRTMANLASNYASAGHLVKAVPLMEEAVNRLQNLPEPRPATLGWLPSTLAWIYDQAGQFARSEPLYRKFLEQARKHDGPDHLQTAAVLAALGRNLLHQKKYTEAEPLLRECLAINMKMTPQAWTTYDAHSLVGAALLGQQKYAEAEPLLRDGYEGMKQRAASIPPQAREYLTDGLERLVQLYEVTGRQDAAASWRQQLDAAREAAKRPRP